MFLSPCSQHNQMWSVYLTMQYTQCTAVLSWICRFVIKMNVASLWGGRPWPLRPESPVSVMEKKKNLCTHLKVISRSDIIWTNGCDDIIEAERAETEVDTKRRRGSQQLTCKDERFYSFTVVWNWCYISWLTDEVSSPVHFMWSLLLWKPRAFTLTDIHQTNSQATTQHRATLHVWINS